METLYMLQSTKDGYVVNKYVQVEKFLFNCMLTFTPPLSAFTLNQKPAQNIFFMSLPKPFILLPYNRLKHNPATSGKIER